jgi:lipoprotein-anchoring transpeptidase ErfK/SrfK
VPRIGASVPTIKFESTSMSRFILPAVFLAFATAPAIAGPLGGPHYEMNAPRLVAPQLVPVQTPRYAAAPRREMGGGFIEFLFGDGPSPQRRSYAPAPGLNPPGSVFAPAAAEERRPLNPMFLPQTVSYDGHEPAGTIIVDTPRRFLFLVEGDGKARRYGIGVGKPGFAWAGTKNITRKAEWPDWVPPPEMLQRRPELPRHMAGGPENPLGARAMYLGSSLYRIHGSNEPWTIGQAVSSGCIRMRNEDVIDLYGRVKVGT